MASATWRMTPVAFREMWQLFNYEYPPYPFQIRSTSPTVDEYFHERLDALNEAYRTLDQWYEPALEALTNPEVRVEIFGATRERTPFRLHIGIRGAVACIATQAPGRDLDAGGEVTLRAVNAKEVGRALVGILDLRIAEPAREWRFADAREDADTAARRRDLAAIMAKGIEAALPVGVMPGPSFTWSVDQRTKTFEIVSVRGFGDIIMNRAAQQVLSATSARVAKVFDTYIASVAKDFVAQRN